LTDLAVFRQDPDGRTRLFILRSSGNRYDAYGPAWTSPPNDPQWTLANLKLAAGNVDGSGGDDLVVTTRAATGWTGHVFTRTEPASETWTAATWATVSPAPPNWSAFTPLVGDFTADGRADLATVTGVTTAQTQVHVRASTGTAFAATAALWWDSGAGNWEHRRSRFAVGNVDGDTTNGRGRADIAVLYSNTDQASRLFTLRNQGSALVSEQWWPAGSASGTFDARTSELYATDINADGRTDLAVFNECCSVGNQELWTAMSTGTGFDAPQRVREFTVNRDRPASGWWKLDAGSGTSLQDEYGENPATALGAPVWELGPTAVNGDRSLRFNGVNQWAETSGPVVRTDRSFTVAAWLNPRQTGGVWPAAVTQTGDRASAFTIRHDGTRWIFTAAESDGDNPAHVNLPSFQSVRFFTWTHVAGVYDGARGEVRLYVNGVFENSTPISRVFAGTGPLVMGNLKWNGAPRDYWNGDIGEVEMRDYAMGDFDISRLANLRVDAGHYRFDQTNPTQNAGMVGGNLTLTGSPGFTANRAGVAGKAVTLNGSSQYAASQWPVLNTGVGYTVMAWVKVSAMPTSGDWRVIASQSNGRCSAFMLRYSYSSQKWMFSVFERDEDNSPHINLESQQQVQVGVWTHVAGVYDPTTQMMHIYVDGQLGGSAPAPGSFRAWEGGTVGRARWNGLQYGLFNGAVDEVYLIQGALPQAEIARRMALA
jgi:hypothetical protein